MRKLIGHTAGQLLLRVLIVSILFPAMLWTWGCEPPERKPLEPRPLEPKPPEVNPMPLAFSSNVPSALLTDDDLVLMAKRYRVIKDSRSFLSEEQRHRLREVRPDIIILKYMNSFAVFGRREAQFILREHPDWVLRDSDGQPATYTGTRLDLDPSSPGWQNYLANKGASYIAQGYDAILLDEVKMVGRLRRDFKGIYPKTGLPYTTEQWRAEQLNVVRTVKGAIGQDGEVILNNVRRGKYFYKEQPYAFVEASDGVVAEGFRGPPDWSVNRYFSEQEWLQNVQMMLDVQGRHKSIVANVKIFKDAVEGVPESQIKSYELYMFATFLLGLEDSAYYSATLNDKTDPLKHVNLFYSHHEIDLGEPLNEFWKTANGTYRRGFERAWVIVDPIGHKGMIIRKVLIEDEENLD